MSDEQIATADMDAILDAALDELDDDSSENHEQDQQDDSAKCFKDNDQNTRSSCAGPHQKPSGSHQSQAENSYRQTIADANPNLEQEELQQLNMMMNDILKAATSNGGGDDQNHDALGEIMLKLQQQISLEMNQVQSQTTTTTTTTTTDKKGTAPSSQQSTKTQPVVTTVMEPEPPKRPVFGPEPPPPRSSDIDRTISNLLQGMAASANTDMDQDDNDDIDEMMKQFQTMGGDEVIDGMMQQLLKKDLMYEPIVDVTNRFPKWLQDNQSALSEEEYTK